MELHQLEAFVVVSQEQTITGAARRLYTTPSTVSMHIKSLEAELDVLLFTRTRQGMHITPKGRILLEKATETLRAAHDFVNHATQVQGSLVGEVAVGVCSEATILRIPDLVSGVLEDAPNMSMRLQKASSAQVLDAVAEAQLDMGFVFGHVDQPSLVSHFLRQVELVVAVPSVWAHIPKSWSELMALPWVDVGQDCPFQHLQSHLGAQSGQACKHVIRVSDDRSRYELVASGVGVSLLERELAEQGVASSLMNLAAVDPVACPLSVVYRAYDQNNPLVQHLLGRIQSLHAS